MNRSWWKIHISGYGAFVYYGTYEEADERRKDKMNWEGARLSAMKGIDTSDPNVGIEVSRLKREQKSGVVLGENEVEAVRDYYT